MFDVRQWIAIGCVLLSVSNVPAAERELASESALRPFGIQPLIDARGHGEKPLGEAVALEDSGGEPEGDLWSMHVLPRGLIYRSYLAGVKEPRLGAVWNYERDLGWIWDVAIGGRVGVLRYGTEGGDRPEGWQLDVEAAALPRLDFEHERDVVATDFRAGVPVTFGWGRVQAKLAYYHLSSHLGDEYMIRRPEAVRINYVRDGLLLGASYYLTDAVRLYAESGWSFKTDGGAEPWEFQFGIDYSPTAPRGLRGSPFVALNGHLRQEVAFGGNLVVQAGWQWRGDSEHLLRAGMQYYNGKSDQYEFLHEHEEKVGFGLWYDF